ncbi:MAG: 5-(carboxyamino)imidazole ribonucleotide mutase [Candidatus Kinetoplastibacterium crithidii]|nr:MAG: 5-(carboxyamino)imidazole ribonucleotide mutase [Candidatus Kinetoplastibacterium crithidii]
MQKSNIPIIGLVMGSSSDWEIMKHSAKILDEFNLCYEARVVSAHRMPKEMVDYSVSAVSRGLKGIIAGAGGAAHLPGMIAALTELPVFGVPVPSKYLLGEDSLLSIVQMPKGIPVATFAIGEAGAINASLHLIANLSVHDEALRSKLKKYRQHQNELACSMKLSS